MAMTREQKSQLIEDITSVLEDSKNIYLADISTLNAGSTVDLRRACFKKDVKLQVVKNKLLKKAMERVEAKDFEPLYDVLRGNTAIMISEVGNAPAKVIKEFRKKADKPVLKAAWVDEAVYLGDEQLDALSNLKSKEELIGDVIALLQSPLKNVVSQLQSSGQKISGIVKTLSEKEG